MVSEPLKARDSWLRSPVVSRSPRTSAPAVTPPSPPPPHTHPSSTQCNTPRRRRRHDDEQQSESAPKNKKTKTKTKNENTPPLPPLKKLLLLPLLTLTPPRPSQPPFSPPPHPHPRAATTAAPLIRPYAHAPPPPRPPRPPPRGGGVARECAAAWEEGARVTHTHTVRALRRPPLVAARAQVRHQLLLDAAAVRVPAHGGRRVRGLAALRGGLPHQGRLDPVRGAAGQRLERVLARAGREPRPPRHGGQGGRVRGHVPRDRAAARGAATTGGNLYGMNARNMSVGTWPGRRERRPTCGASTRRSAAAWARRCAAGGGQRGRAGGRAAAAGLREDPGGRPAAGGRRAALRHVPRRAQLPDADGAGRLRALAAGGDAGRAARAPSLTRHYFRPENGGRGATWRCVRPPAARAGARRPHGLCRRDRPVEPERVPVPRHLRRRAAPDAARVPPPGHDARRRAPSACATPAGTRRCSAVEALFDARLRLFGIPEEAAPGAYGATCRGGPARAGAQAAGGRGGHADGRGREEGIDPQAAQAACGPHRAED